MPKEAFSVGTDDLESIAKALKKEEDGTAIKRGLTKELRKAVQPAVALAKSRIMAMDSSGGWRPKGEPLRNAIARAVKSQTRYAGRSAGIRVRVTTKGMPRGFNWAARRTNREKGWRHPVFARRLEKDVEGPAREETWVHQYGPVGWFDNSMQESAPAAAEGARRVIAETATRITRGQK